MHEHIVTAFYGELEKIARVAAPAHFLGETARKLVSHVGATRAARAASGEALGLRRFIPGSRSREAHMPTVHAHREAKGKVKATFREQRTQILEQLRDPNLSPADRARANATYKTLVEEQKQLGKARSGTHIQQPQPQPQAGNVPQASPQAPAGPPTVAGTSIPVQDGGSRWSNLPQGVRTGLGFTGAGVAGAGALFAGQQYLAAKRQRQPPSGGQTYYV